MKQINTFALYQLGIRLVPLRDFSIDPESFDKNHAIDFLVASAWIEMFFKEQTIPMELSADAASALKAVVSTVTKKVFKVPPEKIEAYELQAIKKRLEELETVMAAELQHHQTYLVSQIGGYSMPLLVGKQK